MVRAQMLQKEMKGLTMIVMTKMTEFVKEHIITENLRKTHEIEVEIDIVPGRTASPVCRIMLDGHPVIGKSISVGKFLQT